ncbi:hypothetical protein BJ508DRAFT_320748 [Ascobolus immersus RN42]|uniref:Uncharacterized protein n=1 Tax=Ascobolus immersus RN42 TaxID=1160509 RepID=A0A3N4IPR4_ASCIM|nr:hypothetical protein BJ508DRAFT_320748 [Ascobolus immersus RN42]
MPISILAFIYDTPVTLAARLIESVQDEYGEPEYSRSFHMSYNLYSEVPPVRTEVIVPRQERVSTEETIVEDDVGQYNPALSPGHPDYVPPSTPQLADIPIPTYESRNTSRQHEPEKTPSECSEETIDHEEYNQRYMQHLHLSHLSDRRYICTFTEREKYKANNLKDTTLTALTPEFDPILNNKLLAV